MASLVKLKQIESGAGIQNAITLAHPAATLTNNAAPFAFDVPTQVGNIPQVGTVSVAGNTLTYTPGDGTPPVTYTPTFAADVFIQSGAYNATTGNLELTLNDATVVTVPLSDLVPIATTDSQTIDFSGDGTNANPVTGQVKFSPDVRNLSVNDGSGVVTVLNTSWNADPLRPSVDFERDGTFGNPLMGFVRIDNSTGLGVNGQGQLTFTPPPGQAFQTTETVEVAGTGLTFDPFKFNVKLQPDGEATQNFIHAASGQEQDDVSQLGLGYTQVKAFYQGDNGGFGPFNVRSNADGGTSGWSGQAEILRVDGYINGVYYSEIDGWNYGDFTAVTWSGAFTLDATDDVRFIIHCRAV